MPEKMLARPLKFWEHICSNMGVTMAFELEGKVTANIITGAFTHIQKEFPFLRTVLKQDKNQLSFVEATPVSGSSFRLSHLSLFQRPAMALMQLKPPLVDVWTVALAAVVQNLTSLVLGQRAV